MMPGSVNPWSLAIPLYDAFASEYDDAFEQHPLRRNYDALAWELILPLLPAPGAVVDVGCGTGRWARRLLARGDRVTGIEPSAGMRAVLARAITSPAFTMIGEPLATAALPDDTFDAAIALGSIQYTDDPLAALRRIFGWLRPGGRLFLHVDSLAAVTLELLRAGRSAEALTRLEAGWGVFTTNDTQARLHLFDRVRLTSMMHAAGFTAIETRGLLVTPASLGRAAAEQEFTENEAAAFALERRLAGYSALADCGKHILAWGTRP